MQLFDLKVKYQFETSPGVDKYNMPLYNPQTEIGVNGAQTIGMYPVYQGFLNPCYINGVQVQLQTEKNSFIGAYQSVMQNLQVVAIGNSTPGPYTIKFPIISNILPNPPNPPYNAILRGHVDISGIIATGLNVDPPIVSTLNLNIPVTSVDAAVFITSIDGTGANVVVCDSGQFLEGNVNNGLLMQPGPAPLGNQALPNGYSPTLNTINYMTGVIQNLYFSVDIPTGMNINAQCYYFQTGLPRSILYYNNTITLRSPPAYQYLVELDAYLTPAAFFNSNAALPFAYMAEYLARGAARKIMSDTGDMEQFMFYEPLFKEQELLVWKRSQRQWTSTRTQTLYSQGYGNGLGNTNGSFGGQII